MIEIKINNTEHFYKIVHWLNKNIGYGSKYWSMPGSPLRRLKTGEIDVKIQISNQYNHSKVMSDLLLI